ncbi:fimbrial protein [Pseudomonas sp. GW531-T4]|uniref:fimbrial protein n=1 Tax=Pseudomonas sp. GW531-T4 TaxID=2075553 RepID=UPI000CD09C02|nr:fimbrial protein [Pseudomonas sp. GW531-T4]POA63343.1 fimbrial protein [Pseudomonas sp. GW531-T4]
MFRAYGFKPLPVFLIVVGGLFSQYSAAALRDVCVPLGDATVSVPFSTSLVARQDVEVGSVLGAAEVTTIMRCDNRYFPTGSSALYFKSSSNESIAVSKGAFKTKHAGIGLKWTMSSSSGSQSFSNTALNSKTPTVNFNFPYQGGVKYYTLEHTFEWIKLGDISAGSFYFPDTVVMTAPDSMFGGLYDKKLNTFQFPTVKVTVPSCYLPKDSVQVNMGRVDSASFHGPGSFMPAKNFSIDLLCSSSAILAMTLDDTHQVSGYQGTIKLSSSAQSAKGVGIQVLNASTGNLTPMLLGQAQFMGMVVAGLNPIKLAARYIQTGSQVSGGKADGTLTFIFSYL